MVTQYLFFLLYSPITRHCNKRPTIFMIIIFISPHNSLYEISENFKLNKHLLHLCYIKFCLKIQTIYTTCWVGLEYKRDKMNENISHNIKTDK